MRRAAALFVSVAGKANLDFNWSWQGRRGGAVITNDDEAGDDSTREVLEQLLEWQEKVMLLVRDLLDELSVKAESRDGLPLRDGTERTPPHRFVREAGREVRPITFGRRRVRARRSARRTWRTPS